MVQEVSGKPEKHWSASTPTGVDLSSQPKIKKNSVCRRHALKEITHIITSLQPLKLHGFGVKGDGYKANLHRLVSADSMAWSFGARYKPPLDGCTHKTCANCKRFALLWRDQMLNGLED